MNQIQQLVEALQRGNLALFLGADLPQAVTGLPSRADLARGLAHRHDVDEALSLAGVAQRVARGGQRFAFTDYLRTQLDVVGRSSQPFHQRLVALVAEHAVAVLVTTAYDDLLERAFQQAGVAFNRVVRGSDVPFLDPSRPTLVKLYGEVQQPDTLIVTEDDHFGLWRDRDKEGVLDEVRAALRRNTVLFLGYNLADPDFALLWREVLDRAGRFARTAYAVWPGLPEEEAQVWRDRRIEILETDPLGILEGAGARPLVAPAPGAEQTEMEPAQVTPGGDVYYIRTEGGAVVIGGVQVEGGDFVGRDQEIYGGPTPPSPPSRERGQSANHEAVERPDGQAAGPPIAAVRDLLLAAFTAEDLRRVFLYTDNADLQPLAQEFSRHDGLAMMVDKVVEFCRTRNLLLDLLREVERANPRMYARFEPRLRP